MRLVFCLFLAALVAGCEQKTKPLSPGEAGIEQPRPSETHAASLASDDASGHLTEKVGDAGGHDGDSGKVASAQREECDFDQNEQIKNNALLVKKYSGSRLEEGYVVIPDKEGEVWVGIGGCAHFGLTVQLRTKSTEAALTEDEFMAKILHLAKTYSQGHVDPQRLDERIRNKQWEIDPDAAISKSYLIHYDGNDREDLSEFEAYQEEDEAQRRVGFTYSYL